MKILANSTCSDSIPNFNLIVSTVSKPENVVSSKTIETIPVYIQESTFKINSLRVAKIYIQNST